MTIDELIVRAKAELEARLRGRNRLADELAQLRNDPKPDLARIQAIRAQKDAADVEIDVAQARYNELLDTQRDEADSTRLAAQRHDGAASPWTREVEHSSTTTRSRDTYNAERDKRGERSFFSDVFQAHILGDVNARARLDQHASEARATSTGSFAGLIVPQYLVEQAALLARTGRPFAESVNHVQLPEQGTQFQIPQGTTGASAAVQATENTAVSNTDEVWTNVTLPVATIAGQQDVSRQSLERGTPGIDGLIYLDLAGAYYAAQEAQVLTGSGASGQLLGVLNTAGINQATAFTAAATAATFQTKVAGQISAITGTRFLPPTHILMHPRRWAWLLSLVDSQGRPLVVPQASGPVNVLSAGAGDQAYGQTGYEFLGMKVVVSAQVPTAVGTGPEDQVILYRADDLLLFMDGEGTPNQLRFEQTLGNQLTVKLVVYGYSAFTAGRYPKAVGVVGGNAALGNGLVNPTF